MKRTGTHYTIGQVSRLAHLSVRALRFFDELELLSPTARSETGYRLYGEADLCRLQQILVLRELGLPLEQIKALLERGEAELRQALIAQRARLLEEVRRTTGVLRAIGHTLDALKGETMGMNSLFEGTEGFHQPEYEEEAKQRWGNTESYRESQRRTKQYGKAHWAAIKSEGDQIYRGLAELMRAGRPPDCIEAMALAEQHRNHIDHWFYPCSLEQQLGLSQMYVQDPRFTANIDRYGEGLSAYVVAAIAANAARQGVSSGGHCVTSP